MNKLFIPIKDNEVKLGGVQTIFSEISIGETESGWLAEKKMVGYRVQVDANKKLIISLDGPERGDFDLYVKYGEEVSRYNWDFKMITSSADETLTIGPTKKGSYYIMVYSYRGSGDFTLSTKVPSEVVELSYGQQAQGILNGSKEASYYLLRAKNGERLILDVTGPLDADFDLYVRHGARPTNLKYDFKSTSGRSKENITIDSTKKGDYHIMVYSYKGRGEFSISASSGLKASSLIISSKTNLLDKYGTSGLDLIERKIEDYISASNAAGLPATLVYVDDAASLSPHGLSPANPKKAGEIKDLIDDLEKRLSPNHFLILGGHSIIPFHVLPNPCGDDGDLDVPSDNPYASRDEDVLIPERSLGRLPDDNSNDPAFFAALLETATSRIKRAKSDSFGYSANVWKRASEYVYETIEHGDDLRLSPPIINVDLEPNWLNRIGYFYFNLHGSEETRHWYGQISNNYPVAFSPEKLDGAVVENAVVCSEACYGANIIEKAADEAISLAFLAKKVACFVGSTKIAYGPSAPPATDADLIVQKFYEHVKDGITFGEAFLRAKMDFARESIRMSGYLDKTGEKTLLEFVMFADPSLKLEEIE